MRPAAHAPTRTILEGTPVRALVFLEALGVRPPLRTTMAQAGYADADHVEGWRLLHEATGYGTKASRAAASGDPLAPVAEWGRLALPRIRVALRASRSAPAALLARSDRGEAASVSFAVTLLQQFDALDAETRKALERRGFDRAARRKLAAAFAAASKASPSAQQLAPDRSGALLALYRWLREWTDVAHAHVTRRDDLIRLGIAKRRTKDESA